MTNLPTINDIMKIAPDWLFQWVGPAGAAQMMGKSEHALAIDRARGKGTKYVKEGRSVRYLRRDILEYMADPEAYERTKQAAA